MLARAAGASLGLLAFTVAVFAGLLVGNPVTAILSRSIIALFSFCVVGFILGGIAQIVVREHENKRAKEIVDQYRKKTEALERSDEIPAPVDDGIERAEGKGAAA